MPGGAIRLRIGIADVADLVTPGSRIDLAARHNTVTLYTGFHVFPMLPEVLSTGRTSLLPDVDRLAVVTELMVRSDGTLDDEGTAIYRARVRNHAKLTYDQIGAWLESGGPGPADPLIAAQVRLHDDAARRLRGRRRELGALDLHGAEARTVVGPGNVIDLVEVQENRGRALVEDLMVAANGATARYLEARGRTSLRRVVVAPRRWDRIVEIAAALAVVLPVEPSAPALAAFLAERRAAAPAAFAELSLSIIKLLGPGLYQVQRGGAPDLGHFGLAVEDYQHSTAPNRRYADLIAQRLLLAAAADLPAPYDDDELDELAAHLTAREDAARKVERMMRKIAAAVMLTPRMGEHFDAVVTGVTRSGTFVRLLGPPAEGRLIRGERGLDVGDRVRVTLVGTNAHRGFVDFEVG